MAGRPFSLALPPGRRTPLAAALALLVHVGCVLLLVRLAGGLGAAYEVPAGMAGLLAPGGGGGGGGAVRFVVLEQAPSPPPPPAVPPPPEVEPIPTPEPVDVAVAPVAQPDSQPPARPDSAGPGAGPGDGSGKGPGSGSGSGGGSGSGTGTGSGPGRGPGGGAGGTARAPEPRQLILPPPDVPKGLRGVTIAVTFWVGADGRVVDVVFSPQPEDRGFARKLEEVMRQYRFRPARSAAGLPVPGTTIVSLTF